MKEHYTALGGSMTLIVPPQQGHNMWPGFFHARGFCVWLSEQESEKKAGRVYSLPTEAQWE